MFAQRCRQVSDVTRRIRAAVLRGCSKAKRRATRVPPRIWRWSIVALLGMAAALLKAPGEPSSASRAALAWAVLPAARALELLELRMLWELLSFVAVVVFGDSWLDCVRTMPRDLPISKTWNAGSGSNPIVALVNVIAMLVFLPLLVLLFVVELASWFLVNACYGVGILVLGRLSGMSLRTFAGAALCSVIVRWLRCSFGGKILPKGGNPLKLGRILRDDPLDWHSGLREVRGDDPRHELVTEEFKKACVQCAHLYPFRLCLKAIYSTDNDELSSRFRFAQGSLNDKCNRLLYHGTSNPNMRSIVTNGFKLPAHAGMFGKGIYFSDTPLKSWQYSSRGSNGWLQGQTRHMLLCDVAVGHSKRSRSAQNKLDPKFHLKRSWLMRAFGARNYDSLTAVTTAEGGAVKVPEYVVFSPEQVLPKFVLEVAEA